MERTPEEIQDLRAENRSQNRRLERVEERVTELRVALVGIDENNGLRGELHDHREATKAKLAEIEGKIDKILPSIFKAVAAAVGFIGAVVGIVAAIIRMLGG